MITSSEYNIYGFVIKDTFFNLFPDRSPPINVTVLLISFLLDHTELYQET